MLFLISQQPFPRVITLEGDLGSGKTTFVKKLIAALGSNDKVSSPTFSLLNEYHTNGGRKIYHSDWYRIKDIAELYDAGMEDYLNGEDLLIVEWPEVGKELLRGESCLHVHIEHGNDLRNYTISDSEQSAY